RFTRPRSSLRIFLVRGIPNRRISSTPPCLLETCGSGCDRACTFVIHDDDASRADYAFRHLEGRRDRALRKQPLSSAQRDRIDHQPEHIDQVMLDKRLKEIATFPNV